ncbi:MAG: hypothetical protein WCF84_02425 [Anaerolineae bacterium]
MAAKSQTVITNAVALARANAQLRNQANLLIETVANLDTQITGLDAEITRNRETIAAQAAESLRLKQLIVAAAQRAVDNGIDYEELDALVAAAGLWRSVLPRSSLPRAIRALDLAETVEQLR